MNISNSILQKGCLKKKKKDLKEIILFLCHLQVFNNSVIMKWNVLKFEICMAMSERIEVQAEILNRFKTEYLIRIFDPLFLISENL